MVSQWNSSPIRDTSYLEAAEDNQRARAQRLYKPMSSPVQQRSSQEGSYSFQRMLAKSKVKDQREDRRQKRLELSREKVTDYESTQKDEEELLRQANETQIDLEQLIEEEEQERVEREHSKCEAAELSNEERYLEELELLLAQEQDELELRFGEMAI